MSESAGPSLVEHTDRNLWSLDEYIVVADLYLRRGRSSGVRDPEVIALADLIQRSPASISRRLGNFDGTAHLGKGLKPVTGEALGVFRSMQIDGAVRTRVVLEATARLQAELKESNVGPVNVGPRLVDPEAIETESVAVTPSVTTRQMRRMEAQLVRRYIRWLDPSGVRLRGMLIPTAGETLRADLFDTEVEVLIEAKAAVSRDHIRYGIGQLFDYRRYITRRPELAMLLPAKPQPELMDLLREAEVQCIWSVGDGFADSVGGRFTKRSQ